MLASELYAGANGERCEGEDACHWCGAACPRLWAHDDPPPMIGVRRTPCKRPGNAYVCAGCRCYRRERVTVNYLGGGFKDRQRPQDHHWLLLKNTALALRKESYPDLYDLLTCPPLAFCLALLDGPGPNLLQLMVVNDPETIEADTRLAFTVNGTPFFYTVYELEEAARSGPQGKEPGVQELVRLLGPPPRPCEEAQKKRPKGGRPKALQDSKEALKRPANHASGMVLAG